MSSPILSIRTSTPASIRATSPASMRGATPASLRAATPASLMSKSHARPDRFLPMIPQETPEPGPSRCSDISVRSNEYYLEAVTFRVEGTLFKVPHYRFAHESSIFQGMYRLPQQGGVEGLSDENPIDLDGVEKTDFLRFLRVLYPLRSVEPTGNREEWTSVLRLATMWGFKAIRELAITQLDQLVGELGPIERIELGYRYAVQSWFLDGLNQLVQASQMVSPAEWDQVGWSMDWAFRMVGLREACFAAGHRDLKPRGHGRGWASESDALTALPICEESHVEELKTAFAEQLKDMTCVEVVWVDDGVTLQQQTGVYSFGKKGKGKQKTRRLSSSSSSSSGWD